MNRDPSPVVLAAALVLVACGGGSSKKGEDTVGAVAAPATVSGGKGTGGAASQAGGSGGIARFTSQGGEVRVTTAPRLDGRPSYTPPPVPALGANPRTISATGTIAPAANEVLLGDDGRPREENDGG